MKTRINRWLVAIALFGAIAALVLVSGGESVSARRGKTANPGIAAPWSHPYGKTYGEWQAAHWQWLFSLPVDNHPLFDTADCSTGQSGRVWFLGGAYNETGVASRDCTVHVGTALFFPIIDVYTAIADGDGTNYQELRGLAEWLMDHARDVSAEIDDVPVKHIGTYRGQSPLFTWGPLPENNVEQAWGRDYPAGTTSPAVSDGFFLMVRPLSKGEHTIHFKGSLLFTAADDGFDYFGSQDITYNLTVQP